MAEGPYIEGAYLSGHLSAQPTRSAKATKNQTNTTVFFYVSKSGRPRKEIEDETVELGMRRNIMSTLILCPAHWHCLFNLWRYGQGKYTMLAALAFRAVGDRHLRYHLLFCYIFPSPYRYLDNVKAEARAKNAWITTKNGCAIAYSRDILCTAKRDTCTTACHISVRIDSKKTALYEHQIRQP